eukprot:3676227-Rhodomonas_salina.2
MCPGKYTGTVTCSRSAQCRLHVMCLVEYPGTPGTPTLSIRDSRDVSQSHTVDRQICAVVFVKRRLGVQLIPTRTRNARDPVRSVVSEVLSRSQYPGTRFRLLPKSGTRVPVTRVHVYYDPSPAVPPVRVPQVLGIPRIPSICSSQFFSRVYPGTVLPAVWLRGFTAGTRVPGYPGLATCGA